MNKIIKETVGYLSIIVSALVLGAASVQLYEFTAQPKRIELTDTNKHFIDVNADIVMYGASWCPACRKTREFLDAKKANYVEHDIENSTATIIALYQSTGSQSAPVLVMKNKILRGFNKNILTQELNAIGYKI